jgi:tetratricopeptide (TPR) repeat protein
VSTYTLGDAARILKVSPARLRYWERTELLQSGARDRSLLEFRDLVCLRGILVLLENGVPLRRIRRNVELLRQRLPDLDDPLSALRLWVEGSGRVVVRHEGMLLEPDGQMVLDFGVESGAKDRVASLSRTAAEESPIDCFERGCQLDVDPATYAAAIEAYRRGIELDPDYADCHCNLGAVYYNQGRRSQARRCFERCLEIDDQHIEARFNLANLLEEDGKNEKALHHYRAALVADPSYADIHINLALLYEKLGMHEAARACWRRYLRLDSTGSWSEVARQRLEPQRD